MPFLKSSREGAQTAVYCTMELTDKLENGGYYADCKLNGIADFS